MYFNLLQMETVARGGPGSTTTTTRDTPCPEAHSHPGHTLARHTLARVTPSGALQITGVI